MSLCFHCDSKLIRVKAGYWTTNCQKCRDCGLPEDSEILFLLYGLTIQEAVMRIARYVEGEFSFSLVVRYLVQAKFFMTPRQAETSLGPTFTRLVRDKRLTRVGRGMYKVRIRSYA